MDGENTFPVSARTRARAIVQNAASQTKNRFLRHWLRDDPQGKWELRAHQTLVRLQECLDSKGLRAEWSDERIDQAVADELCLMGLTALIENKKKGK